MSAGRRRVCSFLFFMFCKRRERREQTLSYITCSHQLDLVENNLLSVAPLEADLLT